MSQFIDRRLNGKNKSTVNRQRFIRRFKSQIKEAVSNAISNRSITNIEKGEKINIPTKDISEPIFHHGQGGQRNIVHSGNKKFVTGDKIKRQEQGKENSSGSNASNEEGESSDSFGFEISREEFLDIFFEDLALPNLVKKEIIQLDSERWLRAGFTSSGVPANINIVRSLKNSISRRAAISGSYNKKIKKLEEELQQITKNYTNNEKLIKEIEEQIEILKGKKKNLPFIDDFDLRYNNKIKQNEACTSAVMFCLMDVSGSMDEAKKDIAKRFFILLYLFLNKNYKKIELVFIRHHTAAKEVDEQEFFYSKETGGTVVSSALELMNKIIEERYPASKWNIYTAQASDGDNWNNDSPKCKQLLLNNILNKVQYYAYVEIMPRNHQSLWEMYIEVQKKCPNFAMQHIEKLSDIYPVFSDLFRRQEA